MAPNGSTESLRQAFGTYLIETIQAHAVAPRAAFPQALATYALEQVGDVIQIAEHPDVPGSDAVARTFTGPSMDEIAASPNERFALLDSEHRAVLHALIAAGKTDAGADPDSIELVEMIAAGAKAEKQLVRAEAKREVLQEILAGALKAESSQRPEPDTDLTPKRNRRDKAKKKVEAAKEDVDNARATAETGHIFRRARANARLERLNATLEDATREWIEALEEAAASELEYKTNLARWTAAQQEKEAQRAAANQLLDRSEKAISELKVTVAAPGWKMKERNAMIRAAKHARQARSKARGAQRASAERQAHDEARQLLNEAKKLAEQAKVDADRATSHGERARSKTPGERARKAARIAQSEVDAVKIPTGDSGGGGEFVDLNPSRQMPSPRIEPEPEF